MRRRGAERQLDAERRALALDAVELDRPAVHLDDRLRDRDPEPGALDRAPRGAGCPEEPLEEQLLLVERDAHAGVGHLEDRQVVALRERQRDPTARRGELDRVRDEVVEQLTQSDGVAGERRQRVGGDVELDALRLGRDPGRVGAEVQQRGGIDLLERELQVACLRLRDEEQVVDGADQALAVAPHGREAAALLLVEAAVRILEHGDPHTRARLARRHHEAEPLRLQLLHHRRQVAHADREVADAGLRPGERNSFDFQSVQSHGRESDSSLFTRGEEHVHFSLAGQRHDFLRQLDEIVSHAAHRRDHHDNLIALRSILRHPLGYVLDSLRVAYGRSAVFLNN